MKPEKILQDAMMTVPSAGMPLAYRESKFNGDEQSSAAGILFLTPSGEGLFLKRGGPGTTKHIGEWDLPGGGMEQGERPEDSARRETLEEIGKLPAWHLAPLDRKTSEDGVDYTTFAQVVPEPFDPSLNTNEHTEFQWAPLSNPPQPLHKGLRRLLAKEPEEEIEKRAATGGPPESPESIAAHDEALAFDRDSVRREDMDGRLHVAISNISKANVCPYRGSEIPNCEELGLDANKVYQLLRDPEELARAAPTFNNIQVLRRHIPVSAEDHRPYDVVGTTGSEAKFEYPYLRNSLSIWEASAIDAVEKEEKRELSCGYHYVADMTPGVFEGKKYDGVMREIVGNHVALVKDGRAGPDVLVGDEAMKDDDILPVDAERVRIRADESLGSAGDREMALTKFAEKKAEILKAIEKATKGKLAKDANLSHITEMLDHLEHPSSDESVSGAQHRAMEAAAHGSSTLGIPKGVGEEFSEADKGKTFSDHASNLGNFLRDHGMDEEHIKTACDMVYGGKSAATDAYKEGHGGSEEEEHEEEEKGEKEVEKLDKEAGEKEGKDSMPKRDKVSSPGALDEATLKAAIDTTAKRVRDEVRTAERERQMAIDEIRQYVGELSSDTLMALDSATQVRRHALKMLGVQGVEEIHKSALPTILRLHKKATAREAQRMAEDAAVSNTGTAQDDYYKRFPGAARLRAV